MKNYLLFALLLSSLYSYSQITISNSDLPSPGDTIRISNAIEFLADPSETGANYTWDYSYLEGTDQYIDSFISPTDAPLVHTLVFNLPWDPDKATVAIMQEGVGELVTGISMEEMYDFFANDEESYRHIGFGASISGVPMPVKYDSPDILFEFPLNYSNTYSSITEYEVSLPTIGFFGEKIERNNEVDGWGTLVLPMGTYDVLRIRSEVTRTDTIYYDAMSLGFALPPITTIEYKWMGIGMSQPLLQINSAALSNTVLFQDVVPQDTSSQAIVDLLSKEHVNLFPNPVKDKLFIEIDKPGIKVNYVEIIDLTGRVVYNLPESELFLINNRIISINCSNINLYGGQYFVRVKTNIGVITKPFTYNN